MQGREQRWGAICEREEEDEEASRCVYKGDLSHTLTSVNFNSAIAFRRAEMSVQASSARQP